MKGLLGNLSLYLYWILSSFAWVFFVAYLFELIAAYKFNKINELRSQELKFTEYIDTLEKLRTDAKKYLKRTKKLHNRINTHILCNQSAAYLNIGENEKAYQIITSIATIPTNKFGAMLSFILQNNLFVYHYREKNHQEMAEALDNMAKILQENKFSKAIGSEFENYYSDKKMMQDMSNGNYEDSEKFWQTRVTECKTLLDKISINFILAEVYIRNEKYDKAKSALDFVITYGKDCYCVKQAVELLDKIG